VIQLFPAKVQVWLATTGLTLAIGAGVGAAGVLAWEHQTPFGLGSKLEKSEARRFEIAGELRQCGDDKRAVIAETWRWSSAYDRIKKSRDDLAAQQARAVEVRAETTATRCRAAFDSGYAAGRALNTGDPTDEPNDPNRPGGVADPGGVRDDFAAAWRSGAVRPSAHD